MDSFFVQVHELTKKKEKRLVSKTQSYQPRRKTSEVERTFQESTLKNSWNPWERYPKIINGQLDIKLGQFTEEHDILLKKI